MEVPPPRFPYVARSPGGGSTTRAGGAAARRAVDVGTTVGAADSAGNNMEAAEGPAVGTGGGAVALAVTGGCAGAGGWSSAPPGTVYWPHQSTCTAPAAAAGRELGVAFMGDGS